MRTDASRHGQAAYEFAIGVGLFAFVFLALVEYAPLLFYNLKMQSAARVDAGVAALHSADGSFNPGANAAAVTSRAHPPRVGERDPWEDPVRNLPAETRFPDWRDDTVQTLGLIEGRADKSYRISMWLFGSYLLDRETGHLMEEVFLPPLGGVRTPGVGDTP